MNNITPEDVSDKIISFLKLSILNYLVTESSFSVEIKIKKNFVKEFSRPKPKFFKLSDDSKPSIYLKTPILPPKCPRPQQQ